MGHDFVVVGCVRKAGRLIPLADPMFDVYQWDVILLGSQVDDLTCFFSV